MKKRYFASIVLTALFLLVGCSKKEEPKVLPSAPESPNPKCKIISPTSGQEIIQGDTILISMETSGGYSRRTIKISLDHNWIDEGFIFSTPDTSYYNLYWETSTMDTGTHSISSTYTTESFDIGFPGDPAEPPKYTYTYSYVSFIIVD